MQDRQHVIAIFSFGLRYIDLNRKIEIPQLLGALAITDQVIERGEQFGLVGDLRVEGVYRVQRVSRDIPTTRQIGHSGMGQLALFDQLTQTFVQLWIAGAGKVLFDLECGGHTQRMHRFERSPTGHVCNSQALARRPVRQYPLCQVPQSPITSAACDHEFAA